MSLKYQTYSIVFQEIPDEVSLAFTVTNCPNLCEGCHSPWLRKDIGTELTVSSLTEVYNQYKNLITNILFLGGDSNPAEISNLCSYIKSALRVNTSWYSGKESISPDIDLTKFDYIKIGPYIPSKGPITSPTTNQILYKVNGTNLTDITKTLQK